MTPDEIKSAITGWCSLGTGVQLVEDRSEPGADFVLGLRSVAPGTAGTVPVEARLEQGGDRLTVSSTSAASAGTDEVLSLLDSRPAAVHAEAGGGGTVITSHIYTDGLSKHTFIRTVEEVAKTRALVDGLGVSGAAVAAAGSALGGKPYTAAAQPTTQPSPWASASPATPQPEATPGFSSPSSTLPAPSFGDAATSQPTYTPLSGQPAPQAQPSASAFAPTHTVPPQGMQAWAAPDPNGAIVATLGGGLPIQVTDVRGAWAHVLCSNGWTGWVDGRIIGVAR
jgi:hypothetical protein